MKSYARHLMSATLFGLTVACALEGYAAAKDVVVAKVNNKEIKTSDLKKIQESIPPLQNVPFEKVFPNLRDQAVVEAVLLNAAKEANLDKDPEVKKRQQMATDMILRQAYLQKQVEAKVTDKAVSQRFEDLKKIHMEKDEVRASHVLVKTEEEAKKVLKEIEGGLDFAEAAAKHSIEPGAKTSRGDLGYFIQEVMHPEFAKSAFSLKKGEMTKAPVKTDFGYHIIKVTDRRKAQAPDYNVVKGEVKNVVAQEAAATTIDSLVKKNKVEYFNLDGTPAPVQPAPAMPLSK